MSTAMASSLLRRAVAAPPALNGRSALYISSRSSRSYVVIPRAVAKQNKKGSVSVSAKDGGRFKSSKVTVADGNMRDIIESEIEALQSEVSKKPFEIPNSQFEVIDNPGEQVITLKRELNNETIKVTVFPVFDEVPGEDYDDLIDEVEDEDEEGADVAEQEEEIGKPGLELNVTVEKGEGPYLEFACSFSESGFCIDGLSLKNRGTDTENTYVGPNFVDLDEGLQDALQRYLEVRGVKNPMLNVLVEYMMDKEGKEYMLWLKTIKRFVSSSK